MTTLRRPELIEPLSVFEKTLEQIHEHGTEGIQMRGKLRIFSNKWQLFHQMDQYYQQRIVDVECLAARFALIAIWDHLLHSQKSLLGLVIWPSNKETCSYI